MTELTARQSLPWYRHGWVWVVFAIPFSAVVFGVVMIVSANYQPDDLVIDDYYRAGMGINQELAYDRRAQELGVKASLQMTAQGAVVRIRGGSVEVTLSLFHVTDSEQDLVLDLNHQQADIYTIASPQLAGRLSAPGIWYLELRDELSSWRLRSRVKTPVTTLELGAP